MLKNKYRRKIFQDTIRDGDEQELLTKTIRDEHVKDKVQRIFRDVSENGEGASHMRKNTIGRFFLQATVCDEFENNSLKSSPA